MYLNKKWILSTPNPELANQISSKFNISRVVSNVLVSRGITEDKEIESFLHTDVRQFADPFLLPDMYRAVNRIKQAISNREKIAVYGDYDVDGITSTYILFDYLKSINADVIYYIPSRFDEGYGLNKSAIEMLSAKGINLIITVDVGISAIIETDFAKSKNIDIVITDHHTPPDDLPKAIAIVNPKLDGHSYPCKELAGVGVAFKLVYALTGCNRDIINKYCEFACIGTISDMVPLTGENRFIASFGLTKLTETENIGLSALLDVAGVKKSSITSSNISFAIAPRLNAAGRISKADLSVELFLSGDYEKAKEIATQLDEGNKLRQMTEQQILIEALDIIQDNNLTKDKVIVVSGSGWHHGVIGIVASKISEKYYKPTVVISIDDDGTGKASGRSVPGFNLYDALSNVSHHLDKFGGHELAAGFSLPKENIDIFRKALNEYAETVFTEEMLVPTLEIDAKITPDDITLRNAQQLTLLEPYGIGNRMPVFFLENTPIHSVKIHKDGKHAFLSLKRPGSLISSPAFNLADTLSSFSSGDVLNIVGTIGINNFRGSDNVQYITKDIKISPVSELSIENLRCVFVIIKEYLASSKSKISFSELSANLKKRFNCQIGDLRLQKALEIFSDVSILKVSYDDKYATVCEGENFNKKTDITVSKAYKEQKF